MTLSERFKIAGKQTQLMATNEWFIGTAAAAGVAAATLNDTVSIFILSTPTVYYGLGMALRGTAALLSHFSPKGLAPS